MIIKAATGFINKNSNADLLTACDAITASLTGNKNYSTPVPALADVQTARDAFAAAMAAAAGGGVALTSAKNDRRDELAALLRALAGYVQLHFNYYLKILL